MLKDITGKVFGDKGYISKPSFQELWHKGVQLITGIRKNMKNYLMPVIDKALLRKRFIIETVFDKLKTSMGLEHSRHSSCKRLRPYIIMRRCLYARENQSENGARHRDRTKVKYSPYPELQVFISFGTFWPEIGPIQQITACIAKSCRFTPLRAYRAN